jgi:ankyrin repeat protein
MVASRRSAEADDVKLCPDVTLSPVVTRQLCSRKVAFMNVQDEHGNTALHMAVAFGRQEMVQYLMQNGASPSMTLMNAQHLTPFTLALSRPQMFNCVLNVAKETVWQVRV